MSTKNFLSDSDNDTRWMEFSSDPERVDFKWTFHLRVGLHFNGNNFIGFGLGLSSMEYLQYSDWLPVEFSDSDPVTCRQKIFCSFRIGLPFDRIFCRIHVWFQVGFKKDFHVPVNEIILSSSDRFEIRLVFFCLLRVNFICSFQVRVGYNTYLGKQLVVL